MLHRHPGQGGRFGGLAGLRANFDWQESGYCDVPRALEGDREAIYLDGCTVENVKYDEDAEKVGSNLS